MRILIAAFMLPLLMPLQAQAQPVELTLNCQYERALDFMKNQQLRSSGSFAAIVRMQTDGTATIDVNTGGCEHFVGWFNELKVVGNCDLSNIKPVPLRSLLTIERVSGRFEHGVAMGHEGGSYVVSYGHCKPSKKLF